MSVIGGKIPAAEHAKLKAEDKVNRNLDRLMFAKLSTFNGLRADCMYAPSELGPLWMQIPGAEFLPPDDIDDPDFMGPVDFGVVWPNSEDAPGGLMTHRIRTVSPRYLRGKVDRIGARNLEWLPGALTPNLVYHPARMFAMWVNKRWQHNPAILEAAIPKEDSNRFPEMLNTLHSAALTYRYEWGAQFSFLGSPKIILPTTPRGVLELFNDRDKPEDRDRRIALRHWVNAHLRTKRSAPGEFTEVRGHLRGCFDFTWRGYSVSIVPSQYDIDRSKP